MHNLFEEYFQQWTNGLDQLQARINIFNAICDMPYTTYKGFKNIEDWIEKVLQEKRGSCNPKHFILTRMFNKTGIKTRLVTCPMRWQDQKLSFPEQLLDAAGKLPVVYHLASQAFINGKWVFVDATYDLPLEKIGAYVTKSWDGCSSTVIAVDYLDIIIHNTEEERISYVKEKTASFTEKDRRNDFEFGHLLNKYLDSIRTNNPQYRFYYETSLCPRMRFNLI